MKRLLTLVAAMALVMGLASLATAAPKDLQVTAKGSWRAAFALTQNYADFKDGGKTDNFWAEQRARTRFRFAWSDAVMAELYTEIGDTFWGDKASGGDLDTDERAIKVKQAFVQFKLPDTEVTTKVGLQGVALPNAGYFSSMVLDTDAGALVMSAPFNDMVSAVVGYTRLGWDRSQLAAHNEFDAVFLALPLAFDGFKLTPWGAYAWFGKDVNATVTAGDMLSTIPYVANAGLVTKDVNPWWVGLAFNMDMLNPFVMYADFTYGQISNIDAAGTDVAGWMVDAALSYKGLKAVRPEVFGAYSSGVKTDDAKKIEVMPNVWSQWGPTGTLMNNSNFTTDLGPANPGFWMVGAALRDFGFVDKLTHEVIFMYGKGTSDEGAIPRTVGGNPFGAIWGGISKKDSYWEVDFNTTYKMYDSLALILELGYANKDMKGLDTDPLMKGVLGIVYDF